MNKYKTLPAQALFVPDWDAHLERERVATLRRGYRGGMFSQYHRGLLPRTHDGAMCHAGSTQWKRYRRAIRRGEITPSIWETV